MKLLFSSFLLIGAALAINEPKVTPDFFVPRNPRIVGGEDAYIHEFPHQVSLRRLFPLPAGHSCGGSIINHDTILTAAHCTFGRLPQNMAIRAGSEMRSQGGQLVYVRKIVNHPNYQAGPINDVSILKLKTHLIMGPNVKPIGLPPRGYSFPAGTDLIVTGWGALRWQGSSPERLQKVVVPYVPNDVCAKIYWYIRPTSICAGVVGVDACQGDSGGPLIHKNFVVGIVSSGDYCAYDGYPGTYARTSEFLDFISLAMMQ